MLVTTVIIELRRRTEFGIFAIPYRDGRPARPVRLPDGAIVEVPAPDQRCDAPEHPNPLFDVANDGGPSTIHHELLGLVRAHLMFEGVFVLSSGDIAAVYGAQAEPIG